MASSSNPLTYKRDTVVAQLQARLAEKQQERQAKKDALAAKNKAVLDQLTELMTDYPQFLVWVVERLNPKRHRDETGPMVGTDEFAQHVKDRYDVEPGGFDPDADLKRLIRVFENAVDDEVKVDVTDDVWHYL